MHSVQTQGTWLRLQVSPTNIQDSGLNGKNPSGGILHDYLVLIGLWDRSERFELATDHLAASHLEMNDTYDVLLRPKKTFEMTSLVLPNAR